MFLRLMSSVVAAPAESPSLKLLALHGYSQNGAVFRDRSGGFRKPLKKLGAELLYVDGPFGCTAQGEDEVEADADLEKRAWWRGGSRQETYVGWPESRAALSSTWQRERCDGVLGFSQGAAAAAMLCADLEPTPKFAIIVSGFVPRDRDAASSLLKGGLPVPSFHLFGSTDTLVEPDRSRALAALFESPTVVEHTGGHMVPSSAPVREQLGAFLQSLGLARPARTDTDYR